MSYLNNVRLIFSGTFQADISTVNNDVRHYDNATFLPRFQDLQSANAMNGWFCPNGSGAFRLIDCRVTSVCYKDGTSQSDPAKDPVIGMLIGGSNTRVSGKLVDLDPQWQMASQIWGLEVKLTDDKGAAVFGGKFRPNAFRDILMTRVGGPDSDGGASAYFQSVIEGVSFATDAPKSTFLKDLREATADKLLSIRLMTFGYVGGPPRSPRYTLGTVLGVIGPCAGADEPSSFVWGRRFIPKPVPQQPQQPPPQQPAASFQGINYFTGLVDEDAKRLFLDLGNALPLAPATDGSLMKIGLLSVGLLLDGSLTEQDPVTPQSFQPIGTIPYSGDGWLAATSGIVSFPLTAAQIDQARTTPLALVTQPENGGGPAVVAMRESQDGILVCAEPSALRIDSPDSKTTRIFASKFGKPISITVNTVQTGPIPGMGGGPAESHPPAAKIPLMGQPEAMLGIPPSVITGPNGRIDLTVTANVTGTPRHYLDGQVYLIQYGVSGEPATAHNQVDYISVHARSAFRAPPKPAWDNVKDILTQFGNLYPIMSQKLFNIADPAEVKRNARLLRLAFGLDISDPNYMPVTRDLSKSKLQMVRDYLDGLVAEEAAMPQQEARQQPAAPMVHAEALEIAPPAEAPAPVGGKTQFARTLRIQRKSF